MFRLDKLKTEFQKGFFIPSSNYPIVNVDFKFAIRKITFRKFNFYLAGTFNRFGDKYFFLVKSENIRIELCASLYKEINYVHAGNIASTRSKIKTEFQIGFSPNFSDKYLNGKEFFYVP